MDQTDFTLARPPRKCCPKSQVLEMSVNSDAGGRLIMTTQLRVVIK